MKILCVVADIKFNKYGGAEAHFVEVLKRILPNIEKAVIIVGNDDSIKREFLKYKNVEIIKIGYPHVANLFGFFYILYSLPKAFSLSKNEKYDLIWAKQEFPQAQVGALLKLLSKVPLYITCQNPLMHKEELTTKNFIADRLRELLTSIISWSFKQADVVACVSRFSQSKAKEMGAKSTVVIPNGVDAAKFKSGKSFALPRNSKVKSSFLRIITVSSLAPRYGVDTLIKACQLLSISYKLTIAGDGPEKTSLQKLSDKNVDFMGRVNNDRIPQLLADSDIFIRPSRYEGFGVAFIEAMACKIPVIATPVGGITDFIKNGVTGLLVSPDNPKELKKAIEKLTSDGKLTRTIINNAYKLVKEKYNWDTIARSAYKEMLKCRKTS